jgi:protein-histidine pros-kinase
MTEAPQPEGSDTLKILLVEDNDANRELATIVLESAGQGVTPAIDGLDALNKLGEQNFDLILMDVQMPRMNGIAATRMIRAIEQGEPVPPTVEQELLDRLRDNLADGHIPIIAMTAHAMDSDRQRCLDAGMDDYLTKPFQPEQVLDALANFHPKLSEQIDSAATGAKQDQSNNSMAERHEHTLTNKVRAHLRATYGLGPDQIEQLLATSASSLGAQLDKATMAIAENDSEAAREAAHAAKGNLLNLGLHALSRLAADLEKKAEAGKIEDCGGILKDLQAGLTELLD